MIAVVVDDSAAMRRIEQKALQSLGWQVEVASNGAEALGTLRRLSHCDLVLTDWHMPEMDGIALVRQIREEKLHGELRIVMVTSESVVEAIEAALQAGANDVVMKPFSAEALGERVHEVMSA